MVDPKPVLTVSVADEKKAPNDDAATAGACCSGEPECCTPECCDAGCCCC